MQVVNIGHDFVVVGVLNEAFDEVRHIAGDLNLCFEADQRIDGFSVLYCRCLRLDVGF